MQALVVVGGDNVYDSSVKSSVMALFPGAATWTHLTFLPLEMDIVQAYIVGGKLRITGIGGGEEDYGELIYSGYRVMTFINFH